MDSLGSLAKNPCFVENTPGVKIFSLNIGSFPCTRETIIREKEVANRVAELADVWLLQGDAGRARPFVEALREKGFEIFQGNHWKSPAVALKKARFCGMENSSDDLIMGGLVPKKKLHLIGSLEPIAIVSARENTTLHPFAFVSYAIPSCEKVGEPKEINREECQKEWFQRTVYCLSRSLKGEKRRASQVVGLSLSDRYQDSLGLACWSKGFKVFRTSQPTWENKDCRQERDVICFRPNQPSNADGGPKITFGEEGGCQLLDFGTTDGLSQHSPVQVELVPTLSKSWVSKAVSSLSSFLGLT